MRHSVVDMALQVLSMDAELRGLRVEVDRLTLLLNGGKFQGMEKPESVEKDIVRDKEGFRIRVGSYVIPDCSPEEVWVVLEIEGDDVKCKTYSNHIWVPRTSLTCKS